MQGEHFFLSFQNANGNMIVQKKLVPPKWERKSIPDHFLSTEDAAYIVILVIFADR